MSASPPTDNENSQFWHDYLTNGSPSERRSRQIFKRIPRGFYPLLTGERHAARAVEAATALLKATGHEEADGPWVPIGAGVHTGPAWVGSVGEGVRTELTEVVSLHVGAPPT